MLSRCPLLATFVIEYKEFAKLLSALNVKMLL